jgi:hypothetical protein
LLGGDLRLGVIATLFPSREEFSRGVLGLLSSGNVILLTIEKNEVPRWRWRELFSGDSALQELECFQLRITPQGTRRSVKRLRWKALDLAYLERRIFALGLDKEWHSAKRIAGIPEQYPR